MERRNQKTKQVGNGEGSLYKSNTLGCYIYQYYDTSNKRQTMKQRKNETVKEFKIRVTKIKNSLNDGSYIAKSKETIITLSTQYVENKHNDGTLSDRSYKRGLETIQQIKKTCSNFCYIPIQKVTIKHIEDAKKEIKKYSNSVIDKIWILLNKAFKIACSPSRKILIYNIMLDENLKKPISDKKTKKVTALTNYELKQLNHILDTKERNHKYRNIIKMQIISGMRIGEVLARSIDDYDKKNQTFNVHSTLTQDINYHVVLSNHTKTYNKKTQIDEGQRFLPLNNKIFKGIIEIIDEQKQITNINKLLFWDYKNNKFISPSEVNSWLNRLNKKYQITNNELTTHRLRHTAITNWKELNIDISVIQYLAGHIDGSSITSKVYIDTRKNFIDEQLSKIK